MISDIKLIPVFDSRGEKTVKTIITTKNGIFWSIAPSGASKSSYEPLPTPMEKLHAIEKLLKKHLIGKDEHEVDKILEKIGGKRFQKIGANVAISVSQAVYKSIWKNENLEKNYFPIPLSNVLGGGAHGGSTRIQEFLVFPKKAKTISEAVEVNIKIRKRLKEELIRKNLFIGKNDEGALISRLSDADSLELVSRVSSDFPSYLGLDMASTQFYEKGIYKFAGKNYKKEEWIDVVSDIIKTYKIKYIEDPFHEKDFSAFSELTKKFGKKVIICGDDIYSTNPQRVKKGIVKKSGNAVIIKPNQVGLVSLALKASELAKKEKWIPIASHRSGESEDWFIAEFALHARCPLLKCSVSGSERMAKWNYLIEKWEKCKKPKTSKFKLP